MKVVCVSDQADFGVDEDGTIRPPRPDERLRTLLTVGKVYEVLSNEGPFLRIIDDSGKPNMYGAKKFRPVDS